MSGPREIGDKGLTEVPISKPKALAASWLTKYLWLPAALLTLSSVVASGRGRVPAGFTVKKKENQPYLGIGVGPRL